MSEKPEERDCATEPNTATVLNGWITTIAYERMIEAYKQRKLEAKA